ncbi:MAG: restriction endonuclease subunit S [Candidatus Heimdallarchaeota archaeon]|nr:restriction endonuclease subunit S [Candidatus Heimdallarchaeota archaeon]
MINYSSIEKPDDWEITTISNLTKSFSGGTPNRKKHEYWRGDIPWAKSGELNDHFIFEVEERITNLGLKNSSAKIVEPDTLLIALYGATAGKVGIAKKRFAINQAICALPPSKKFHTIFFFYYFMFIRSKLLLERYGGAQPNLSQQIINNIKVPLPPLSEQEQIAAVLSTVQEAKEKTAQVIAALQELKKSMMQHLFTYGPVAVDQHDQVVLQETEIGLIPKEWEVIEIEQIAELIMGQSPPGSSYNDKGQGMPFLQGKAEFGRISPQHIKYTTKPMKIAELNSILISVRAPVGDVNIANIKYCIGRGLASISFRKGDNLYLYYLLIHYKNYLELEGTGSTFKAITKNKLAKFKIPYPNITIQKEVSMIINTIDLKIEKEENKKQALEELFRTLLTKLMAGEIRVNNLDLKEIES